MRQNILFVCSILSIEVKEDDRVKGTFISAYVFVRKCICICMCVCVSIHMYTSVSPRVRVETPDYHHHMTNHQCYRRDPQPP